MLTTAIASGACPKRGVSVGPRMLAVAFLTALLTACCATPLGMRDGRSLVVNEFMVDSEPGISIFVRNKHPAGMERFESAKTVVFVHGATYPSETSFDLALDGESWMDYIARKGYDVYLLDVRGYGRSTRPPQMDKPAQDSLPFAQTEEAVRDVGAVVDFVRKRLSLIHI